MGIIKLSPYCNPGHMRFPDSRWKFKSARVLDADYEKVRRVYEANPDALIMPRNWALSEQHDDMFRNPEGTGRRHADELAAYTDRVAPMVPKNQVVVTGINEPRIWNIGGIDATVRYTVSFLDRLTQMGRRGGALNLSVGWPANNGPDTPVVWEPYGPVRDAILRGNHFLVLHEYWSKDSFNWRWWAGRYTQCPWNVPIIIGECGLDQYVAGPVPLESRGWKSYLSPQDYVSQLTWYDEQIRKDSRIHSAQVFCNDFVDPWHTFDTSEINNRIVAYQDSVVIVPPSGDAFAQALLEEFKNAFVDLHETLPKHATDTYSTRALSTVKRVVVHHSGSPGNTTWDAVARWHVDHNNWPGIGYHLGVLPTGQVAYLGGLGTVRWHAGNANTDSVGICCMGNYMTDQVSEPMLDALVRLVGVLRKYLEQSNMPAVGHRDVGETLCPGDNLETLMGKLEPSGNIFETVMWVIAAKNQVIRLNPDAAIQKAIYADGFVPTSNEYEVEHLGKRYVCQRAEHLGTGEVRIYYCLFGNYMKVMRLSHA